MLLNPDPRYYRPLFGLPNMASTLLGPRRSGVGGNEALYKAISKLEKGDCRSLDKTIDRMFQHLTKVGHPGRGPMNLPWEPQHFFAWTDKAAAAHQARDANELWSVILESIELGANASRPSDTPPMSLTRVKRWAPFLASAKRWIEYLPARPSAADVLDFIGALEFTDTRSAQWSLKQLKENPANKQASALLELSAVFFILACLDADLDWLDGDSFFCKLLPVVEDGKVLTPLRRWMSGAQRTLGFALQADTSKALLSHQAPGDAQDREGKRLWSYGGMANDTKAQLFCPSRESFGKMLAAITPLTESDQIVWLYRASVLVTGFTNLFNMLNEFEDDSFKMMIFDDYDHYFELASKTKGPPPIRNGGGQV